jgi:hypothetical protein
MHVLPLTVTSILIYSLAADDGEERASTPKGQPARDFPASLFIFFHYITVFNLN